MSLQPFAWFWWHFAQWRTLDTYSGSIVTISNFWKSKMAAAAIFTVTKIAIPLQQFDRSIWNLVRWCKMGLLNAPTVKKISKVKHGGQPPFWKPLNCHISILMKFGTVTYIGPLQHTPTVKITNLWNPRWPWPLSWKPQKSRYLYNSFTDLYEIWYNDTKWGFQPATTVKKFEFKKSNMVAGRHFENR